MKLLWPNIIFALKTKAKSLSRAIINDAHIIIIWKKDICPEKSIINHQMFLGLLKEVLCLVSLMTSPLRDWLDMLLMVAFNYLEGISMLLHFILKWPENISWLSALQNWRLTMERTVIWLVFLKKKKEERKKIWVLYH